MVVILNRPYVNKSFYFISEKLFHFRWFSCSFFMLFFLDLVMNGSAHVYASYRGKK